MTGGVTKRHFLGFAIGFQHSTVIDLFLRSVMRTSFRLQQSSTITKVMPISFLSFLNNTTH